MTPHDQNPNHAALQSRLAGFMSRRLLYVFAAALLMLAWGVIVWRVFRVRPPAAPQSLAADAALLTSGQGKWQSEVVNITVRDGAVQKRMLGIEFKPGAPAGQSNAPNALAKLFTSSPTKSIPLIAEGNASFGDANYRDVRLRETNGVRTITFTRAVPADDPRPEKTQRIYNRYWSVSFPYELQNNVLTLKGFPATNKVTWGVSEFILPQAELKFKIVP